jgi:leucyl aminopeptidase
MLSKLKPIAFGVALLTIALMQPAYAKDHAVIVPQCLIKKTELLYHSLAVSPTYALIQVDEAGLHQLIAHKIHQKSLCGGFVDVTETLKQSNHKNDAVVILEQYTQQRDHLLHAAYDIQHQEAVSQLWAQMNPSEMWRNLTVFSSFNNRYSHSQLGLQAALWIQAKLTDMVKTYDRHDVRIYLVNTGIFYTQPSVAMKIGTSDEPAIVVSAHLDTLSEENGVMPGADDDGSGTVTVLEIARTVLASPVRFKKPIYLVWYAAEEEGLVGSQYVVADFKKQNIAVDNVIHFDMTGYAPNNDPTMWLLTDFTDTALTHYMAALIKTYVKVPVNYTQCGYACSDHATWNFNGYTAAIATEAKFGEDNPYIHTSQDTMGILSLAHMTDFAKLGVAFVGELAGPV